MTEEHRTLIETFLPVDEITKEAKIEKIGAARPPISSMHYWWTRKPLVVARAAVLGALVSSNFSMKEYRKLLGLGVEGRSHFYDLSDEQLSKLRLEYEKNWGESPMIVDPFAGGGSIPFEAMRLGVNTIAIDYNPEAHLIEKATLEFPRKYGKKLFEDVKKGLCWVIKETEVELEQYYPKYDNKNVAAYLWAWCVKCPKCGFEAPLVGQWWLLNKERKKVFINPSVQNGKLFLTIETKGSPQEGTCSDAKGKCLNCGSTIPNAEIKASIGQNEKEILLAIVTLEKTGYGYFLPSDEDAIAIETTNKICKKDFNNWIQQDLIPLNEISGSNGVRSGQYLQYWHKMLNPRQKILFVTIVKKIRQYYENLIEKHDREYSIAIAIYLSFLLGKHIDYNCRSATLNRQRIMAHALTSRGLSMAWDHAEINPFVDSCGSLIAMSRNILDGIEYSVDKLNEKGFCEVSLNSITKFSNKTSIIITDPPYYDDVQYAELSEFFYVWEAKALKDIINLGDIQKTEEMSVGGDRDEKTFNKLFRISCNRFYDSLTPDGILIMFFAHSSVNAWDFVINSLQKTGFRITATWPIHTESSSNPLASGNASIMSSIIIVARKRKSDKSGYIEEIQDEVKAYLMKRLDEFWKYGLRGADLTVSAMGATLDIITQYSEIKSYTGEMQIKDVLELVQKYVAQYVLDRYMKNSSGLDAPTSFYIYARLSLLEGMPFDTANLIAKSMNVDLKLFEKQGLIETSKKGKTQGIKILNFSTREINPKQSLIDCVQFLMTTFAKGGYTEVEHELATIPFSRNEIKDVLEALLSLPTEDPERQVAQKILERMGQSFPKQGQTGLDNF